jgi:hypothetical protein
MRTSSPIELNSPDITAPGDRSSEASASDGFQTLSIFDAVPRDIKAQMARRAGRLNASSISDDEESRLFAERKSLLDKEFDQTITRAEMIRLEYVRWSLDRIEDAKHGPSLDALERRIARYEAFAAEVQDLKRELQSHASRRR